MPQEGEAEVGVIPDAIEALVGKARGFFDGVGAQIGQLTGLEVSQINSTGLRSCP